MADVGAPIVKRWGGRVLVGVGLWLVVLALDANVLGPFFPVHPAQGQMKQIRTPRKRQRAVRFDLKGFLAKAGAGRTILGCRPKQTVFAQGDPADEVFYILRGKIKVTVLSRHGKEAVIAMLGPGDFFGEGCLAGQSIRMATAIATTDGSVMRIQKEAIVRLLHKQPVFSAVFMSYVLSRNIRIEEDLVDQLFNSSEKRLARTLLLLARVGKEQEAEVIVPKISQESLAEIIGTTRARVSFFMNKFRKLGLIEYNGGLRVHSALLNVVLHD